MGRRLYRRIEKELLELIIDDLVRAVDGNRTALLRAIQELQKILKGE